MNIIWKRPDGFHAASPSDFEVVELPSSAKLWLHKRDKENFPFRVSGGWQDEDSTKRLNTLVNFIDKPDGDLMRYLERECSRSRFDDLPGFLRDLATWLQSLQDNLKGDTWEISVMSDAIQELQQRLQRLSEVH